VGEFNASGMVFKDTVELVALKDPQVAGVTAGDPFHLGNTMFFEVEG